jgi:hypothetical protein
MGLPQRFESTHAPLSYSRRLMGKFRPVIPKLACVVNRIQEKLAVSNTVAPQFIGHQSPWLTAMHFQQTLKEPLGCVPVSTRLQQHVDHFTVLIDRSPHIVLPTPDLHKDFIYVEGTP